MNYDISIIPKVSKIDHSLGIYFQKNFFYSYIAVLECNGNLSNIYTNINTTTYYTIIIY